MRGHHHQRLSSLKGMTSATPGPRYENVRPDWLVPFLYSKFSIAYIAVVGAATAFNLLLFFSRMNATEHLRTINDLLPIGKEMRKIATPVFLYLRATEFCIPINTVQLLLTLAALLLALNRKNVGYLFCYYFLITTVIFTNLCILAIWVITIGNWIRPSVKELLFLAISEEEEHFCDLLEPNLDCRLPNERNEDVIARVCGGRLVNEGNECSAWLTHFLDSYLWLVLVSLEGLILMGFGVVVLVRSFKIGYIHVPVDDENDGSAE